MTVLGGVGYFNTGGPGGIPGSTQLFTFDLNTEAQTLIGSLAPTITADGISGLATLGLPSIPEPASIPLLGFAGVGLLSIARYRRV